MYFLKRLLLLFPLLLVISFLAFALVHVAPGGPFDQDRKPASPEIERNLRARFHLDEPVWKQYLRYFGLVWEKDAGGRWKRAPASFDISYKYRNHRVSDIVAQALPVSFSLGLLSFCFALGVGVPWGVFMAVRRGRWSDYAWGLISLLAVCIPGFVVGPILIMFFAVKWQWFPVAFWASPMHAVLPTLTLGLFFAGKVARLMRESMTTTLQSEFIVAARAKGLSESALLLRHALRIAILPVVSFAGPMMADLLTGSFVVENIFQIPGLGVFVVNSSLNRDYQMLVGLVLLYAVVLVLLNLAVDFTYMLLDRRVKYE